MIITCFAKQFVKFVVVIASHRLQGIVRDVSFSHRFDFVELNLRSRESLCAANYALCIVKLLFIMQQVCMSFFQNN